MKRKIIFLSSFFILNFTFVYGNATIWNALKINHYIQNGGLKTDVKIKKKEKGILETLKGLKYSLTNRKERIQSKEFYSTEFSFYDQIDYLGANFYPKELKNDIIKKLISEEIDKNLNGDFGKKINKKLEILLSKTNEKNYKEVINNLYLNLNNVQNFYKNKSENSYIMLYKYWISKYINYYILTKFNLKLINKYEK